MRMARLAVVLPLVAALAACDTRQQLKTLAHADSLRVDSLGAIRNDLMTEVMASTQFINDINTQMAKVRDLEAKRPGVQLTRESEMSKVKEERDAVLAKISATVERLNAAEGRIATLRSRASKLSRQDSTLLTQIAQYEKNLAELKQTAEQQRTEMQAVIDKQTVQIATLNGEVDTLTKKSVALTDTVGQLTTEKNTAYYVVGTKDELVKKGVLVEEGHKSFLLFGSRRVEPARQLDPSAFTRIDRLKDTKITLPAGEYDILSRHNATYAQPDSAKDGHISGGLTIQQPEQFWAASKYLIIVRS